ncbi:VanZ family protein [Streptomyces sp. CAU 1734]|uniref:VanZ family protein n=1 Tax=Streptomyces sp. CAU 1734 TaxID=3140360 RepID=UPI003260A006
MQDGTADGTPDGTPDGYGSRAGDPYAGKDGSQAGDHDGERAGERAGGRRAVALRVLIMTLGVLALIGFSFVLARLTLTPSTASADIAGANLRPGRSLNQYVQEYTFLAACKQIGGNLLLGVPFGLFLPVLVPRRMRMLRVVLTAAVVMMLVELVQGAIVEGRAFDVDDVILNTTGALIGYLLIGRRVGHHFHALARRRDRERPGKARAAGLDGAVTRRRLFRPGRRRVPRRP